MTCTLERSKRLRAVFLSKDSDLGRELADVEFQVTDAVSGESRAFHSVRALCAVFSPVLKAMFFGHMAEARCSVPVTDCRLQGFEWLLAYIYGLQPKLSAANVVSVLQCAAKYGVTEIVDACVALISEMQAIDDMLPIAAQIERLKLDSIPALKRAMDSLFADNGFAASKFHELYDNKGATLTVVLTEFGHVIGGFTNIPWTSANQTKADTKAWLFVSRVNDSKKKEYTGVTLPAILKANSAKSNQIYGGSSYGPVFGSSGDLVIANNCNTDANSWCGCTGTKAFIPECDGVTLDTLAITGGSTLSETFSYFRVANYEVFSVK